MYGARAEKPGFTITLKHDLDPNAGALNRAFSMAMTAWAAKFCNRIARHRSDSERATR
jgi:hypothetical protein